MAQMVAARRKRTLRRYPELAKALLVEANVLIAAGRRLQRLAEKVSEVEGDSHALAAFYAKANVPKE